MGVTLRVVGPNGRILGDQATKVFTGGGRIGRAEYNDWVLPDAERFISSDHAEVVPRADGVYIVDRSINGTFVNSAEQPIGHGNSHRLREGDRLRIGEYDILVSLSAEPAAPGADVWPAGAYDSTPTPTPHPPPPPQGGFGDPLAAHESVDPLDHLGGSDAGSYGVEPGPPPADSTHPAPDFGSYARPQPQYDPLAPADYGSPPATDSSQVPSASVPPGGEIPEDWDRTTMPPQPRQPAPSEPPPADPVPPPGPPPSPSPPFQGGDGQPFPGGESPAQPPQPGAGQVPPPAAQAPHPGQHSHPMPPGPRQGGVGLEAVFEAAGLDQATARAIATQEHAEVLGVVLREAIQGMMDILSARAQIKNQFRVSMTQITPVENNPLKFCVNAEDAMQRLFVQHSQGFLAPGDAFGEAFEDVKAHQMAVMAGMRAAFDHLMQRFDPRNLQEEFDRDLRRSSLLQPLNKNKYWDMLTDLYEEINRDGDANFSRLFGDEFARAYEEQMERLRRR